MILEDEKTLEQCGIHRSMGAFEYLWVDSKENQEKYKEEKERMILQMLQKIAQKNY